MTNHDNGHENPHAAARNFQAYAWVGEDEFGSGSVGFKQFMVFPSEVGIPLSLMPAVSPDLEKITRAAIKRQLHAQAKKFGKSIYLVRLRVDSIAEVIVP